MIPPLEQIEVDRLHRPNKGRKKEKNINVDMNPMVDLAFLLLTFFMLATTFSRPQVMELLIPAKPKEHEVEKETPVKESKTLSLLLTQEKLYWYKGITDPDVAAIDYQMTDINELLIEQKKSTEGLVVLIKSDSLNSYGNLVQVIDLLNVNEVQRYAIAPLSEFDLDYVANIHAKKTADGK